MKIQQFQGGLATRQQPQFLNVNEGAVYTNIDNSLGTLTPVKQSLPTDIALAKYQTWFHAEQEWVDSTVPRDYLEYKQRLYWSDRTTRPQLHTGTSQVNLGISVPPKVVGTANLTPDSIVDITAASVAGAGLPAEELKYILVNSGTTTQSNAIAVTVPATATQPAKLTGSNIFDAIKLVTVHALANLNRNVEFSKPVGIVIGSGGVDVYRLYEGEYYLVGNLATDASVLTDSVLDISANAILDNTLFGELQGVYQYQLTYYNSALGLESGPSPISVEYDLSEGGRMGFTTLPVSSDPQVDKKRLYRLGGNLTTMTLVVELDNATTTYTDELRDTELPGDLLQTAIALPAPTGLAFLTEAYAMLFGALDDRLRFTPIGEPDQWPELYFLQFDAPITGLAAVTGGILVFTYFKTFLVTGTGPTSLSQQLLTSDQGCIAFESVQVIAGTALWASTDGICASSGNETKVISKDKLGKLSLDPVDSIVYDEAYYLLEANGSMLVFDFAYGGIYKRLSLGNESLVIANDVLYGWRAGKLEVISGSLDNASLTYKSPRFIEGSVTDHKTYKNVRFFHKGDIIVKIWIDDRLVATGNLTGTDTTIIKIPQEQQRGFYIQFELTGTGEVYEYEYDVGHRQHG
jgi:hypothetical protein